MFNISLYTLMLIVHVAAGSTLFGLSVVAPMVRRSMLSAVSLGALRMWVKFHDGLERMAPPSALVLLATGVYLGSIGWWTQPWFYVATAAWVANSALAGTVVKRSAVRLAASIGDREGHIDGAADATRRSRGWDLALHLMRANDLAMLYVMFEKPSLVESGLVMGAAIAISVALGARQLRSVPQAHGVALTNSPGTT